MRIKTKKSFFDLSSKLKWQGRSNPRNAHLTWLELDLRSPCGLARKTGGRVRLITGLSTTRPPPPGSRDRFDRRYNRVVKAGLVRRSVDVHADTVDVQGHRGHADTGTPQMTEWPSDCTLWSETWEKQNAKIVSKFCLWLRFKTICLLHSHDIFFSFLDALASHRPIAEINWVTFSRLLQ